jgi:ATP-dependent Clp protease ATP-binding subunit ClpC
MPLALRSEERSQDRTTFLGAASFPGPLIVGFARSERAGRLTDAQGHTVDFKNTVIIMTSNLGTRDIQKGPGIGFAISGDDQMNYDKMKDRVMEELKRSFRPEFLNRIDEVIVFHNLTRDNVKDIVDLMMKRVREQLKSKDLDIVLTEPSKELLAEKGYDPSLGARPLRRTIQRLVEDPLSEKLLWKEFRAGQTVIVDAHDGEIVFESADATPDTPPVELAGQGPQEG